MAYLSGEQSPKYTPELNFDYELILAIANEGCTDLVMNAARAAGATGGTVVHGKGTGSHSAQKFYAVSLASEKEIVLILTKTEQKTAIMRSILKEAGPDSPAGLHRVFPAGDGDRRVRVYERGGINSTPWASVQVTARKPFSLSSPESAAFAAPSDPNRP